jgi:hypothetical protein
VALYGLAEAIGCSLVDPRDKAVYAWRGGLAGWLALASLTLPVVVLIIEMLAFAIARGVRKLCNRS